MYMLRIECGKAPILGVPNPVVGGAPTLFSGFKLQRGTKGVHISKVTSHRSIDCPLYPHRSFIFIFHSDATHLVRVHG